MTDGKTSNGNRKLLVTGGAGFIGSHLVDRLLEVGDEIVVLDNFNDFYTPSVKRANVAEHLKHPRYRLIEGDLRDDEALGQVITQGPFDAVVHLAAMAGVRPSISMPTLYMDVNVTGTQKLLSALLSAGFSGRFVFGSSSSVYGSRSGECFSETDRVDQPMSPYAASKAAGELLCYGAHQTCGVSVVCLRFFTVFGPRQRPDLAIHKFCRLIDDGKPIEVYGDGSSKRDYTYVADIVFGIEQSISYDFPGFDIINLGRSQPVVLMDMINGLEQALGKKAKLIHKPFQIGDVPYTYASITKARQAFGYEPSTDFNQGLKQFVTWYLGSRAAVK
jgi:UDP-glucuronate 4-epimerase